VIRPLRKRHTALATVFLALLAPAGLLAGVLSRPDAPLMSGLPDVVLAEIDGPSGRIGDTSLEIDGLTIAVRTWKGGTSRFLQLAPERDLQLPDVLVYWTPEAVTGADAAPPADALLVGSLAGARPRNFVLPTAAGAGGSIMLFSLGHQRGLGSVNLPGEE